VNARHPKEPLLEALAAPLSTAGFDLEDVEVMSAGRRRVVRVLIDKDGGITLDDISDATTVIGAILDHSDALGEAPYTLEVTSPGVDRPLTQPRHWRRNLDRLVTVTPHQAAPLTGRIASSDETGATISTDTAVVRMAFADIAKAKVEIEFNREGTSGKKRRRAGGSDRSALPTSDAEAVVVGDPADSLDEAEKE
jgi:ribosome maturation factor RimP